MTGAIVVAVAFPLIGSAVARLLGGGPRFLLGLGTVGTVLYAALLLHIPPLPVLIALLVASATVLPGMARDFRGWWRDRHTDKTATAVILLPVAVLLFVAAIMPLADFDGRAFWVLKAKAVAVEKDVDGPFFHGGSGLNPKNEYPLLVPLAAGAVMMAMGETDDLHVRWIYVLALGSLALHARRWVGAWPAALIAWLPQFAVAGEGSALSGYNDVILAAFAACAFFELIEKTSPLRFGAWLSFLVLTKNEGLPFAFLLLGAAVWVWRKRVGPALLPLGAGLTILVVWRALVEPTDDDPLVSLLPTLPARMGRLVPALTAFAGHAFSFDRWGLFWVAVIASAAIVAARREWETVAMPAVVMAAMSSLYVAAYMITNWQLHDHVEASADRLLMHLVGPAVFLIGAAARSRYSHDRYRPTGVSPEADLRHRDPSLP